MNVFKQIQTFFERYTHTVFLRHWSVNGLKCTVEKSRIKINNKVKEQINNLFDEE